MRAIVLAALLAAPALAGCLGQPLAPSSTLAGLDLASIQVPQGAEIAALPGGAGAVLTWVQAALPFRSNVTIPAGVTLVRIVAEVADGQGVSVAMSHAETGRRRCNGPFVTAWDQPFLGRVSCAGATAVDDLPAVWAMSAASGVAQAAKAVRVELRTAPLDGPASMLDLSLLSKPTHELLPTEVLDIPAHDGAPLHLEVTRPDTPGKVPVILASSPYNHADRAAGSFAQWRYFVQDWAMRGYGVVMADVRGYGESGGCVEVWGPNEQRDQVTLVEWAAAQPWSDGRVGFYGQSYVGTTPVEAAVQAPEALKAIVAIAPVINAYDDWHFGGVPNGEGVGSAASYQQLGTEAMMPPDSDPLRAAENTANGLCDPTLAARTSDPRAIYDSFYAERNFSSRAGEVKAAVLYTQGFEDSNVKSAMITHWFNALAVPKLGLFGHWIHQHPTRADQEILFLAWMDQYVKGKAIGLERLAAVDVVRNDGTHRTSAAWPPVDGAESVLWPDLAGGALGAAPVDGQAQVLLLPAGPGEGASSDLLPVVTTRPPPSLPEAALPLPTSVALAAAPAALAFTAPARVHLAAELQGADNAYVAAFLYDVDAEGKSALVTWGMTNLAHRNGHDRYDPVPPAQAVEAELPLLPTEWVVQEGHALRLVLRASHVADWTLVDPTNPGVLTLLGGAGGTRLVLPLAPAAGIAPLPASATL
jgi:putative CocE/NonD family hydrolase